MRRPVLVLAVAVAACAGERHSPEELLAAGQRGLLLGDLEAARASAEEGRRLAAGAGDREREREFALLYAETLVEQRRYAEALSVLEDGVRAGADGAQVRALVARGLARCRSAGSDAEAFRLAEADLAQADRLARELGALELAGWVTLRRGSCALYRGDAESAEQHFRGALAAARRDGGAHLEIRAAGSLGFLRARAGRFDDATDWFLRALELARDVDAELLEARTLGNLGWCAYELGDYERALAVLSRAEQLAQARGLTGDLRIALTTIGNAHYRLGEPEQARLAYRRALPLARDVGDSTGTARLLGNLGSVAIELGQYDEAEDYVRQALSIKAELGDQAGTQHSRMAEGRIAAGRGDHARAEAIYADVIASPHTERGLLWETRAAFASLLVRAGRRDEAEAQFREAMGIMERFRSELRRAESKISFFSSLARFYDSYVDFLVETGRPRQALEVADRSRARLLRETLERDREVPAVATGRFLQSAGSLDAVMLFYWIAPGRSFLWEVTAQAVELHILPDGGEIERRVEAHQARILQSRDPLGEGAAEAEWLFEHLVRPARSALAPGPRVVVVPDGPLHRVNFETLVVASPEPHYWIEDVTLSTAPSLALLSVGGEERPQRPARNLLLIGDAVSQTEEFPPLPYAATEVRRVAGHFAPTEREVYTGARAEPGVYRRAQPGRFSIIHFAAHAKANREVPLDSAVILTARDDAYKLYAREIVDIPLRAELVTLSACRSAGSRSFAGEGLVGLAWAFLSAGAANVIAGLWNVEDVSTSQLMDELYAGLERGSTPAEALRAAKLKLLRSDSAHRKPYYWAPFGVYTGGAGTGVGARPR